MKKLLYLPVILLLFTSCSKINSDVSIFIEGIIVDQITTEILEGVEVKLFTNNKTYSDITDENGYFSLGEFALGDYYLILSKDGYATEVVTIRTSQEMIIFDSKTEIVKSYFFGLYPLNEQCELTLYRMVNNGTPVAAANFPYKIILGDLYSVIEGTTDESGLISLDNVASTFRLIIDHEYNGIRYKYSSTVYPSNRNYVIIGGYETYADLGLVSSNILDENGLPVDDFPVSDPIVVKFTVPVDTEQSEFSLERDGWSDVSFTYSWSDNNTTITIVPGVALTSGTNYELSFNVISEDALQYYYDYLYFDTAGK